MTSPRSKRGAEEDAIDPRAVAHVPDAVRQTPTRLTSMDPSAYDDVALSPGELGGSQYIMSPGHELASSLQRSESTMSDGRTAAAADDVAAASNQRLFPIFVRGRKVVHLVRHGQSTYNEAISGPGSWDEPNIFDAPLTKLGVRQARGLGPFLSKLPKDAVWVTSPLTRAMETCVHGYKSSLEVAAAQRRKAAAMSEAAGGGVGKSVGGEGKPPSGRAAGGKSRLSRGGEKDARGETRTFSFPKESDENGGVDERSVARDAPAPAPARADDPGLVARGIGGGGVDLLLRGESSRFSETNGACDEQTPAPATLRRLGSDCGELGTDAVGASPSETLEPDAAEMSSWGERVIVHPHLSEKLATSGDIGRCKGVLMNEFPLLGLSLSRLPGDVWWYNRPHHPNDAERQLFQSHEPTAKFKERVATFRHWLMSREDKTFVVFGHSTFFKELVGGNRSLKNCEVHTYHL